MWAAGGWKRNQAPAPALSPIFGREPAEATLSPYSWGLSEGGVFTDFDSPAALRAELSFWEDMTGEMAMRDKVPSVKRHCWCELVGGVCTPPPSVGSCSCHFLGSVLYTGEVFQGPRTTSGAVASLQTTLHRSHSSKHRSLRHPVKGLTVLIISLVMKTSAHSCC